MKNKQIGYMLKKYRKQNSLSVNDVVLELSEKFGVSIAEKTIYGWESNQSHPSSDILVALCDIYRINNLSEALSESQNTKSFPITPDERILIKHYREHPQFQEAVRKLLEIPEET